ncbi:hypothetical protein HPB51_006240 [Rhipicephalus microplus]|uniref:Uncharacterized protein n=1 Tax=Rhipicephalus microplus TaxID=6941 RepID=A0A9J6DL61_RHIMP|nr:hypothetical protein HPB51_006240 [Rhipicephalus microplus]
MKGRNRKSRNNKKQASTDIVLIAIVIISFCWRGSVRGQPDGGGLDRHRSRRRPSNVFMRQVASWISLGTVQGAAPELGSLPPLSAEDHELLTPWVVVVVFTVFLVGFARGADELFQDMGLEAYYSDEDQYMARAAVGPGISREHLELRRQTSPVRVRDVDGPSATRKLRQSRRAQRRLNNIHRRKRDTLSTHAVQSIADRYKPKIKPNTTDMPNKSDKSDTPA